MLVGTILVSNMPITMIAPSEVLNTADTGPPTYYVGLYILNISNVEVQLELLQIMPRSSTREAREDWNTSTQAYF